MSVNTAAGTRISIGPIVEQELPATDAAAITLLGGLTYVEIGEVENIGDYGDTVGDVTFASLGDSRTRHLKGLADAGTMDLTIGFDNGDAGQIALVAAQKDRSRWNYAFKVTYEDGLTDYFLAKVMSLGKTVGGAEDVIRRSASLGINSPIYEDAA
jgi:hypothetical protein